MKNLVATFLLLSVLLPAAASAQAAFSVGNTTVTATPLATGLGIPWELV